MATLTLAALDVANMYGPHFLVLYGVVIASTLGVSWVILYRCDKTGELRLPPIPSNPDPYHIALLRGGENEATRVLVFSLIQRGLRFSGSLGASLTP